jgi:hypothetical protein
MEKQEVLHIWSVSVALLSSVHCACAVLLSVEYLALPIFPLYLINSMIFTKLSEMFLITRRLEQDIKNVYGQHMK